MTVAGQIERRPLHHALVDRLRHMITEGTLEPGGKISERELCEQFGVSRTPLREALNLLAAEGLVSITPHRGASVTELTLADLEECFPVMGALEAVSGRLACQNATEAEIAAIRARHAEMVAHYEAGRLQDYFRCNEAIHDAILEAARNPTLAQMSRSLAGRVRRARYRANMTPARWARAVAEHLEILSALEARDAERLGRVLNEHLANKLETVKATLSLEGRRASKP